MYNSKDAPMVEVSSSAQIPITSNIADELFNLSQRINRQSHRLEVVIDKLIGPSDRPEPAANLNSAPTAPPPCVLHAYVTAEESLRLLITQIDRLYT